MKAYATTTSLARTLGHCSRKPALLRWTVLGNRRRVSTLQARSSLAAEPEPFVSVHQSHQVPPEIQTPPRLPPSPSTLQTETIQAAGPKTPPIVEVPDPKTLAASPHTVPIIVDGITRSFDPIFIRDSCTCPKCVDHSTKQKDFSTTDIPEDIRVKRVGWDEQTLSFTFEFENDMEGFEQHHTNLSWSHLDRSSARPHVTEFNETSCPWNESAYRQSSDNFVEYESYMNDDSSLSLVLRKLHQHGLVFIDNVPELEKSVSSIAERIGPLKNTFYGSTWDVRNIAEAKNVAYTGKDLGLHMDLLYMSQPPRLQFLHCLRASASGGTSLFSDSYWAVKQLFKKNRKAFDILASENCNFHYLNDSQMYHQTRRTIQLRPDRALTNNADLFAALEAVNWSPPFQGPFHSLQGDTHLQRQVREWHWAARQFRDLIESKEALLRHQMPPGQCVIFDNRRVLHARTAFEGGERWLRGAYLDSDPFDSRARTLAHL